METTAASSSAAASSAMGMRRLRWNNVWASNNIIQAPLLALFHYSGLDNNNNINTSSPSSSSSSSSSMILNNSNNPSSIIPPPPPPPPIASSEEEVSIRIVGAGDEDDSPILHQHHQHQGAGVVDVAAPTPPSPQPHSDNSNTISTHSHSTTSHTYAAIHRIARCLEHILPFSLLLLVVFIRQHLQGFFGAIWISAVLFKSNDILRKQTALKGERRISLLVCITLIFMFHVFSVYWWYQSGDLIHPLILLPPKTVPPFWHAIFVIIVNDTMVRQAVMVLKCILLMYFKNSGGHNYRKQGQMLTLVEYMLLLYRALLPTPVWYRFFLNKEYGSLFSSLTTGLYLTFKLTSIVQKVQLFFAALKALSRKEVHYGSYATSEQVNAAGDICAICQEKMHAPILLSCNHIFCEDCVSEWFERERTCPLCRALVRPADIKSYGDGSTSLFFQIF